MTTKELRNQLRLQVAQEAYDKAMDKSAKATKDLDSAAAKLAKVRADIAKETEPELA